MAPIYEENLGPVVDPVDPDPEIQTQKEKIRELEAKIGQTEQSVEEVRASYFHAPQGSVDPTTGEKMEAGRSVLNYQDCRQLGLKLGASPDAIYTSFVRAVPLTGGHVVSLEDFIELKEGTKRLETDKREDSPEKSVKDALMGLSDRELEELYGPRRFK
jgi:hypothetical protein